MDCSELEDVNDTINRSVKGNSVLVLERMVFSSLVVYKEKWWMRCLMAKVLHVYWLLTEA